MVAHPPGHGALLAGGAGLVGLALNAEVHDVFPADGAVVHHNIQGPHLKPFLVLGSPEGPAGTSLSLPTSLLSTGGGK